MIILGKQDGLLVAQEKENAPIGHITYSHPIYGGIDVSSPISDTVSAWVAKVENIVFEKSDIDLLDIFKSEYNIPIEPNAIYYISDMPSRLTSCQARRDGVIPVKVFRVKVRFNRPIKKDFLRFPEPVCVPEGTLPLLAYNWYIRSSKKPYFMRSLDHGFRLLYIRNNRTFTLHTYNLPRI